jgi:CRP-like cAMP-binding protein
MMGEEPETAAPWRRNRLLAALGDDARGLIAASLKAHRLARGTVLFHPGDDIEVAYFPVDAMISLVLVMPTGEIAEVGLIGREGVIGGLISSGHKPAYARAVVQIPGVILKASIADVERAKMRSAEIQDVFARYADCFLAQVLQSIVCNARHGLEQRLARWLLAVHHIQETDELPLTHEYLSEMLGVQRTTVTAAAASLQRQGLIRYARGRITLLDLDRLEEASCRCQAQVQSHYERIFTPRRG